MLCKYCKSKLHMIDKCKTLFCKKCNKSGHPHWMCKKTQKNNFLQNENRTNIFNRLEYEEKEIETIYNFQKYIDLIWSLMVMQYN